MKGEAAEPLLSFDNPVLSSYAFYAVLLLLKMFAVAIMTSRMRFLKKVTNVWCSTCIMLITKILYQIMT